MLKVTGLYCERDERVLFENLDFTVRTGQVIQVQGSNGSGKTTLLRILCGLNSDYSGDIEWQNSPMAKVRVEFYSDVFYMGHMPAINKTLSPVENLRWFCASQGFNHDSQIASALAEFGLTGYDDMPCYMLSAGQQRRVSLARMLLTTAKLWILDEPFTALDKTGVAELEAMLADHAKKGGSVILTTHHSLQMDCAVTAINLDDKVSSLGEQN